MKAKKAEMASRTSIIIPVYNQLEYTKQCLHYIKKLTPPELYELIVIDNASTDGADKFLASLPDIKVFTAEKNLGVGPAWNIGIRLVQGEFLAIINNDIIVCPNWLENMLKAFDNPDIWCVCPRFTNMTLPENFEELALTISQNPPLYMPGVMVGFFFIIRREVIDKLGLFDEQFETGWFEDTDFNYRLVNAGHPLMIVSNVLIHHFEGRTLVSIPNFFEVIAKRNAERFMKKWNLSDFPDAASDQNINYYKHTLCSIDLNIPIKELFREFNVKNNQTKILKQNSK